MKKTATTTTEATTTTKAAVINVPKNFRQQADIESFYRFVYENDLREDALEILQRTRAAKNAAREAKARVKH